MCHGTTKLAQAPADSSQRTQQPRNGIARNAHSSTRNAHFSKRNVQLPTRSAQFPTRCFRALRRQTKSLSQRRGIDIVIVMMIVVVPSSGMVFRQWSGRGSDNGRNHVAATALGLVDSPVVELFAVAFLEGSVLSLSLGLRVSFRGNISCERSSKRPWVCGDIVSILSGSLSLHLGEMWR